ncbi:MAG: DUF3783 domain-containing protein [Deltaproteobacteria bacterium]|nr:DUF3783 domain-containing protein [Deltaproteobacteria bacterium]
MSHKGTFKKIGKSKKQMYGPRKILVCGYPATEQDSILSLIQELKFDYTPTVFATESNLDSSLKDILALADKYGLGESSNMKRAIIMSGLNQQELQKFMTAYKYAGMPPQLWAGLTPISENWLLKTLLDELSAEAEAFKKLR